MFSTHFFCLFIYILLFYNALGEQPYGPHPRIVSDNGNLVIYAADHKNVTLRTTSNGYINLNDENLILIVKEARNAAEKVKTITTNVINPFSTSMNRINDLIDGPDGLLKRVSYLEGQNSTTRIPSQYPSTLLPNRARQFGAILRRVRALELKMASMYNLLITNECASNPCKNGGECTDIYNGYLCRCTDAWTGPTCETDVNECGKFSGTDLGCQNGATCVNKQGSYECICVAGWFGIHCNRRTQDCNSGPPQELCGHGICVSQNTGIGYKCICDQGWKTDGNSPACSVDVNECESAKPHCSVNPLVPCINVPGTFYCGSCPQGYSGNGYYCSDIDECLTFNGGCSMNPRVQCINTMGSRMCGSCPPGYIGDGVTCSYRGVCQVNNGGCHQLARCVDNPNISDNFVQCICPSGYVGSGMGPLGCTRTDISPYISACSSNPCVHGTCMSHSNSSFTCLCQNGYSGITCNIQKTSCDSNPCLNGGTCSNTATGYACECTSNYTGSNCDSEREVCGGYLENQAGFLQYPLNNNSNYNHKVSCSWVIETLPDKVVNITFTKFHVEDSVTCKYDWLQIHDGPNSGSHLIGRFCGTDMPKGGEIISSGNSIYLWFRSDGTVSNPGFALRWESIDPVCGGLSAIESHGIIKSPGFPGHYPPNRDCFWVLIAPYGKRIQLHFFSLMIGNNANCSNDYLELRTGSFVLKKYCNSSHPEPFISAGSNLGIWFHSDESGSDEGFQIAYSVIEGIPGCGGTFTLNRGEITSPIHDQQYPPYLDCDYKIKVGASFRINIIFLSFALEYSSMCRFDFLEIRDGGKIDSPLVGRYCGLNIPPSYSSLGNELLIRFKTDGYVNDGGFRIKYDSICSQVFDTPTGKFESSPSETDKSCTYEIKQQPQKAIVLKFTDIDSMFRYGSCSVNFIEVRDGDNKNSPLIGKYCGHSVPDEIISTHNYLWILFKSDIIDRQEFKAEYSTIDLECGGIFKESHGVIKSPESPNKYPSNTKCTWLLNAPPGFSIQINWINFDLEYALNCNVADYVSLYENNTDTGNSSLMGQYCGKKLPPIMTSTTNVVTIIFRSDMSFNANGFSLIYSFLDDTKTCGGNYFVSSGLIQTPNYPRNYFPNKECVWVISVPNGQQIMLNIEDFELEQYLNCRSDYLEIRNGAYENSPLIGTYCGKNIPKQIPSHTNNIYLKFHSDNALNKKGFKILWDGTARFCGGTLTSPSGQIASPNYPQSYGANAMCYWHISTSAGSVLNLMFLDLQLEEHMLCRLDYVEIYDGLNTQSKSFGRFCSDANSHAIQTSTNRALIKFRSDVTYDLRGFLLKYSTLCNITLTGYRGAIESLNFPNFYPKNQDCVWTIVVPKGNKINITFSHFELEYQEPCKFDYLEITELDDYGSKNTVMEKNCGTDLPPPTHTSKNRAEVHFVSDSLVHAPGFRLEWVVDGCSQLLSHPTGDISTPGYPYEYPHELECHWKIQVEFNSSIMLNISDFGFETSAGCMYDSLEVFNGPDEHSPSLTKICHNDEKTLSIVSTSNVMFVKFTSDVSYGGKGFNASYKTIPNQCGGKYTAPQGSIHSGNYPKNYKGKDNCEWLIELHESHIVELIFIDLDLIYSTNCSMDYLKVYDGNNDEAPLLYTLCGSQKPNDTIRSSTNSLYIRMSVFSSRPAKGFLANYTTGCGMRKTVSTNGILDIADWGDWECSWTIIADTSEKHVSLTITHLEVSKDCDTPPLKIYDGLNDEAPLIGSYCGNKAPPMLVTKGSAMHIALSYSHAGYLSAIYSVLSSDCGGTYTSLEGYFSSVGYPNSYPLNTECQWTISLAPGNKVQLSFQTFDLVTSENCNADYVEVREKNAHGKLVGIYCGNTIPSNITNSESLWVQFKSSDIGTAKGFLAEYTLVHGNELFGPSGEIASPLYPKSYEDSSFWSESSITWRITVDFQSVVLITFKDFYINWFIGTDCLASGLEIYDGYDDSAPLLASLCTLRIPDSIRTTSNVAFIKFFATPLRYNLKFWLQWKQIRPVRVDKNFLGNTTDCGSPDILDISSIQNYTLQSPGYPNGYAGRLNCEWIFSSKPGTHLSIRFDVVDLEASSSICMLDSVKVYSGEQSGNFKLLKTVCLSESLPMIDTSNLMKVVFKTDAYINKTGFSALILEECGGTLSGPNGVIVMNKTIGNHMPGYVYQCSWNVTVKPGRTIELRFLEFKVKNTEDRPCVNYIMFKNGIYPDSPLLGKGKYCDKTLPNINATTGNSLRIDYAAELDFASFKILYKEVSLSCGGNIVLYNSYKSTNISSPNYPNIPPPHTECVWIITGPPGESLQIDFIDRFDLTYSKDCKQAGVELRDGGTMISNLIGVYCSDQPSSLKSTDNILYIRFFTDVNNPRNGFSATISIETCGGVYRGKFGKLTSPLYPSLMAYPANTICTWQIIGPIDHYLTITFNDFKFPYMRNCSNTNHLLVKEKLLMGNETVLGTFCGLRRNLPDLSSSSNIVTIQMKIVLPQREFKGFSITYNASQEACGGELDADSGIITSPGYPVSQHHNRNCEWRITAPAGRRITIHILDFDLDYTQLYYNQGLAFFNAKNYRSHIIYMHGNDNTNIVRSSGNHMMVYFWSLRSSSHRGFKLRYESNEPTICVGDFSKDSGVITTPTANLSTYYCQWDRRADENTPITNRSLTIVVDAPLIGKATSYNCKHVTSSILISTENEEALIAQLCGAYTEPQIVRTPFPNTKLMITQGKYHDMMNYTITYKINPCGGILSTSSGFIASPNYPNRNTETIDCAWLIKIEDGQAISINFTTIDLDTNCGKDYIDIYNGPLPSSPKIGRYCGKNNPGLILSQNNALWIDYHSSKDGKGKGFSLTYEPLTSGCGGIFHDRNRVIESPNYPNSYPNDAECNWEVHADEGYHIGLSFTGRFHLEQSPNCTNDFIEVFDYIDRNWVSLGRNCGRNQTNYFNSTTNRMRILFRSNSKLSASGFQAVWSLNCGGTFMASTTPAYLTSPGYPREYAPLLNCNYILKAPGKYVNVVFEDFKLEAGGTSKNCGFDNVTISRDRFMSPWMSFRFRNYSHSYTTLGVFCGVSLPPPVRRPDSLIVSLKTDKWVNRKGFRLRYFIDFCGGAIKEQGEITSPKDITGKNTYYGTMRCVWNITAPTNYVVVVRFTFFELEHHRNCQYDSISLYNGIKIESAQRLALLCGNITTNLPVIRSSENNLLLTMKTDASNNLRGFKANVLFMYGEKVGCGGTLNLTGETSTKILKSPDIDNSGTYLANLDCQWLITAAPDESIEITFEAFHMNECANATEEQKCTCDYLQIRDGGGPLAELTSQLCGHNLPTKVLSSRNQLWVRMVTDGAGESTGFRASIKRMPSICGPSLLTVTSQKQYLTSPNYPNNYPDNTRCSWTLISPLAFTKMEIHFDELQIQDSTTEGACNTDKLEIADKLLSHIVTEGLGQNFIFSGPKHIPTHLGVQLPTSTFTYCGTSNPPSFYSIRNEIVVTFTSDHSINKKGFRLDYRITGCNHNYTGVQGRILNEASVQNCVFKITAPENYTISIYFQQFFMQSYYNTYCNPHNIEVFDGMPSNDTKIVKLCGFQLPSPIFSNTNEVWFKVNNNRRGVYDFIYTTTNQGKGCGGQLFNFMGKFTSPLYPSIYRKNAVCRWDISVPIGLQASLKFLIFDLGYTTTTAATTNTCTTNFVELIDIDPISKTETVRSTYCAGDVPAVFQASANMMALRYSTTVNNAGSGWVAVFSSKAQST